MISFILPTRNRTEELLEALKSLRLEENGLEALIWIDTDDPKKDRYLELFDNKIHVRTFVKDRVGYINFHLMANFLCHQARYDWLMLFNDDAYMENPKWFEIFRDEVKQFDPIKQPVVLNIWGQSQTVANLFPAVSRAYFDITGHFSLVPNTDDWIRMVSTGAGISYDVKGIKPAHRKYGNENVLKDETYMGVERDRAEHKKNWNERRKILPQKLLDQDINKILQYTERK